MGPHEGFDRGAVTASDFSPRAGIGAIAVANASEPHFALDYGVTDFALRLLIRRRLGKGEIVGAEIS
jgi:hypothetical protein